MQAHEIFWRGFAASFIAAMGTEVGAVGVFFFRRPSSKAVRTKLSQHRGHNAVTL